MAELTREASREKQTATLARLSLMGAPVVLLRLWTAVCSRPELRRALRTQLDYTEFFSGDAELSSAMIHAGLHVASFDSRLQIGAHAAGCMDFLSDHGFLNAVVACGQLAGGAAGAWLAPPCGTWVWINRGTSRRSRACPLGARRKSFGLWQERAFAQCWVLAGPPCSTHACRG